MEKELLDQLIKVSGLTQKEVSEKTGIPQPHLSRWVNGKRTPKLSTIYEIAGKLDLNIEFKILKNSNHITLCDCNWPLIRTGTGEKAEYCGNCGKDI